MKLCEALNEVLEGTAKSIKPPDNKNISLSDIVGRWREMQACNDTTYGESKSQNFHDSLLDLTFLIAATDPKASIY